ncbi:aquaporin Z [Paraoerskovia marina]|uniref:Aquaporin Z n=1 Tax=Paraoerskovia marina TaxID=545619 RepID=A0A1H1UZV7_9CELL|nr:aquaporin [Paraoerskovia marina]SDS77995.1 aquaporin Z [Paraoerskovia marina]
MSAQSTAPEAPREEVVVEDTTATVESPSLLARLGAEAFGTFLLVLAICGVALYARFTNAGLTLSVALAGGLALVAGIAAVGHISGGHFNPAVTFGAAIAGRTSWADLLPYWAAQLVGGTLATLVLFATIPSSGLAILQQGGVIAEESKAALFQGVANGYGEHSPLASATQGAFSFELLAALLIEIVVTAILVGVILAVTRRSDSASFAPMAIGFTLAVMILIAAPVTNASVNPARSFAAAVFAGDWAWTQLWVFIVAPLAGGAIAALFYRAFTAVPVVQDDLLREDQVEFETVTSAGAGADDADVTVAESDAPDWTPDEKGTEGKPQA